MDIDEKNKRKKIKAKKYKKLLAKGEIRYAHGGEYRLMNTEEDRGKRRYGFRRTTVQQKHFMSKKLIKYRQEKGTRIYCRSFMSYLQPSKINKLHKDGNINQIIEEFYSSYQDPQKLLTDYRWGFRDPLFSGVVRKTGLTFNEDRQRIFLENYEDILSDSIVRFLSELDNYVEESKVTFYSYMCNILPYRILSSLLYHLPKNITVDIDLETIDDETYDLDYEINILGIHILKGFRSLKHGFQQTKAHTRSKASRSHKRTRKSPRTH